jgi:hypothetical protein
MNIKRLPTLVLALGVCSAYAQHNSAHRAHAFAALPDWTGYWQTGFAAELTSLTAAAYSGKLALPAPAAAAPPGGKGSNANGFSKLSKQPLPLFATPPYNPEWAKKSQIEWKRAAAAATPPSLTFCKAGFPFVMDSAGPEDLFQVLVTPEETVFLFGDGETRHIYTDGRSHPRKEDLWPTIWGDSIGHWEGGTLVIDTIARAAGPISDAGPVGEPAPRLAYLSEQAHFTERVKRIDANSMQDEMSIDDPLHFSRPWKLSIHYQRATDVDRMILYDCNEHDRNPIVKGKLTIAPP